MNYLLIILFMTILLGTPLLVGYGLRRFINGLNPQYIANVRALPVQLVAQILCVLGAGLAIMLLKVYMLGNSASLLAGALFFVPGLLILAILGKPNSVQAPRAFVEETAVNESAE
jgi:hypothetical protein